MDISVWTYWKSEIYEFWSMAISISDMSISDISIAKNEHMGLDISEI
jgi:hypothetical protein